MTEKHFLLSCDLIGGKIELYSFDILCPIIQHCNYGASPENMIRDRLVCGINNDSVQKRLLAARSYSLFMNTLIY